MIDRRLKPASFARALAKFFIYWFCGIVFTAGFWVNWKFGTPSFDQILYHIQFGVEGVMEADRGMLRSFVRYCIIYPLASALILVVFEKIIHRSLIRLAEFSLRLLLKRLVIFVALVCLATTLTKLSFWSYLTPNESDAFYAKYYLQPTHITPPVSKRNLILIYIESLENTYSNTSIFGRDLLKPLHDLSPNAHSFQNYLQAKGADWTIAGIIATQCGIPLQTYGHGKNDFGSKVKSFMPGAICLGDILKDAGYKNVFLGGAFVSFSGKSTFLKDHGYDELYGRTQWEEMGEGERNMGAWGLYDDLLFKHARDKVHSLAKQGAPYNLTIHTVDTHHPDGFINATCKEQNGKGLADVVECTSRIVANFITDLRDTGYLQNTDIVILGDHLAMPNTLYTQLQNAQERTVYNSFITTGWLKKNRETMLHFDMFPTILYMMGFRFPQNRLALGSSGFGQTNKRYEMMRQYGLEEVNRKLAGSSKTYRSFWKERTDKKPLFNSH